MDHTSEATNKPAVATGAATPEAATTDLWWEVGRDFDQHISITADKVKISKERLLALLIAESFNESGRPLFSGARHRWAFSRLAWFKNYTIRHWPDLLILVLLPLLVTGFVFRGVLRARKKGNAQVIVQSPGDLPAFHKIRPDEVKLEDRPSEPLALTSLDKAIGNYSLVRIAPGSILHENQILSDKDIARDLSNRLVLRLPAKANTVSEDVKSVSRVTLLFSGGQSSLGESKLVKDVILLGVNRLGESNILILAVTDDQIESMHGVVGRSEVFVLQ